MTMKKTKLNPKRKEIKKRIKENSTDVKQDFLKLVRRASQPIKQDLKKLEKKKVYDYSGKQTHQRNAVNTSGKRSDKSR